MTTYTSLDNVSGEERIDSRDLIDLREDLAALLDDELTREDRDELAADIAAIDELADVGIEDWEYGAQLIRADTFEDYARELAEDIGAIPNDAQWPCTCIDWGRAARELAVDFLTVTFLGHNYCVR